MKDKICKHIYIIIISFALHACTGGGDNSTLLPTETPQTETPQIDLGDEAFYSFDETAGATTFNSSFDLFHGQISGATRSIGKINNSLYFGLDLPSYVLFSLYGDPSGDIVVDFPNNEISIEAWIKFESLDLTKTYHFFGDQLGGVKSFRIDVIDGQFRFTLYTNSTGSESIELIRTNYTFGVDVWYHIAFTYDGSNPRFYIDGVLNNENGIIGTLNQVHNNLFLGDTDDTSTSFPGYIDELRFSSVLRTPQEIDTYYQSTK